QISEAIPPGAMTQTRTNLSPAAIDSPTDVDMYSFSVTAGQRISFDIERLSGSTLAAYLRVFDGNGNELANNAGGAGPGESPGTEAYLEQPFNSGGTYFVGVSGLENKAYNAQTGTGDSAASTGAYTLIVSPGITGTIVGNIGTGRGTESHLVDI